MSIEEQLELKTLNFLKNQNKELKDKIIRTNNYSIKIAEEIEIEILKVLQKFEKEMENK